MTTWILLGVTAVVLVAVIIRLIFGGSEKRDVPMVFDTSSAQKSGTSAKSSPAESLSVNMSGGSERAEESVDLDRTSIHGVSASMTNGLLDSVSGDDSVPGEDPVLATSERPVPSQETAAAAGTNRLRGVQRSVFSEFRGIVRRSDEDLTLPEPEELPVEEEDLAFGSATPALAQMLPETKKRKDRQRQDLLAAGYHSRASWLNLNSTRFVLAFLSLLLVGLGLIMAPPAAEPYLLAAVIAAPLVAWALPPLIVSSRASERRTNIERGLPDILDMLNMGVSQGLTVQSALRRIGPEISAAHPELAEELSIVNRQARMGTLRQALHNFAQRIDSPEVTSFTSLLIQSDATGTSVTRALTDYSESMRSTFRERADARANAASFKLLFPITLCLMPSVFMFLLGPAVVTMSDFFGGTATELLEGRQNAMSTLDQAPRVIPEDR